MEDSKEQEQPQEHPQEQPKVRLCPLLSKPCIQDECSWYMRIQQQHIGAGRIIGTCALVATVLIVSANIQMTPPRRLDLPPGMSLGRG